MTEIIKFPTKENPNVEPDYDPATILKSVHEKIVSGEIPAEHLIVCWSAVVDSRLQVYYRVAGDTTLTNAVGLLEVTKASLLE